MTQKKSYSRYFIILQEDEKGYAVASDKLPSGYTKLEMKNDKCKISFYVQNLKKESTPYYIALICGKKDANKIIKLAELNIDEHGKAEITHESPIDNIAGASLAMDKISGAAIVRFIDTNMVSVMCGFIGSEIGEWKKFDLVEPTVSRSIEQQEETKSIFDKYEEEIERIKQKDSSKSYVSPKPVEVVKKTEIITREQNIEPEANVQLQENIQLEEDGYLEQDDRAIKPSQKTQTHITVTKPQSHNTQIEIEEEYTEEHEEIPLEIEEKHEGYPVGSLGEFFRDTVSEFEELRHVSHEIKRCKWYKVDAKKLECAYNEPNYNTYTVVLYPMMGYYPYIKKHGHFVVGHKCDKEGKLKYLVYGIPGTKSKMEQPFGGKSGFVTWIPMRGNENESEMGYWVMFYDFKNSTIVIPVR